MTDIGEGRSEGVLVPVKVRPPSKLMNVSSHSSRKVRRLWSQQAAWSSKYAQYAFIRRCVLRQNVLVAFKSGMGVAGRNQLRDRPGPMALINEA
jgi:hypothetical protein